MKFSMKRNYFLTELATVQRAISSKTTIPILTGLKIQLEDEGLTLTGSNSDISIEKFIDKDLEEAGLLIEDYGGIVVPARFFSEIIKKLPEDDFLLEVIGQNQVRILSGKADFTINGLDVNEYPQLPVIESYENLVLPARVLNRLISETIFATSTQESRPILTGVHFILQDNRLKAVATDSHRLSQRVLPLEKEAADFDIVVPNKSLQELSRSFDDEEEMVEMTIMENQALFKTKTMNFYTRLLEGFYPDTDRLIPNEFSTEIEFYVPSLLSAVERASLLSHEGHNNIIRLEINDQKVTLYGNSPEIGNVEEDLVFEEVSGDPLVISFNPDYMKAALRAFGQQNIKINFVGPLRAFTLVPMTSDEHFIQLVTPVRTSV